MPVICFIPNASRSQFLIAYGLRWARTTLRRSISNAQFPLDGAIIKPTWFRRYDQPPARAASSRIIQSWDTASKAGAENHWSVCITVLIHEKKYYLLHVLRGRFDYPTLKARAISHAEAHKASRILVEDAGVGTALVAELQKAGLPAVAIKPEQNKRTRMSIQSSKIESGRFFVPTKQRGCLTLRQNCSRFRTHDMMIRSTPSAKHWLMGPNLMDGMRIQIRLSLRLFKDFANTRSAADLARCLLANL